MSRLVPRRAIGRPAAVCLRAAAVAVIVLPLAAASAATLSEKAKESGCLGKPRVVEGSMYKCETSSGVWSYFNVPGAAANGSAAAPAPRISGSGSAPAPARAATPAFPRVDPETQKGRDDVRRRVLQDELAAEEKLLNEARASFGDGAPTPLPEERADSAKYRERIARLRQAVALHERNVEALRKEIGGLR